jgi:hypothetical protein
MNGKKILDSFDLDDHRFLDKEIDTVSELNRNAIVIYGKGLLDLEADSALLELVRHETPVGSLQQSWPQSGMDAISGAEDDVRESAVNEMNSVFPVRGRVLRGSAFVTQRQGRI